MLSAPPPNASCRAHRNPNAETDFPCGDPQRESVSVEQVATDASLGAPLATAHPRSDAFHAASLTIAALTISMITNGVSDGTAAGPERAIPRAASGPA
jgi:hypothetical protein